MTLPTTAELATLAATIWATDPKLSPDLATEAAITFLKAAEAKIEELEALRLSGKDWRKNK
jgi:hypothetical protein